MAFCTRQSKGFTLVEVMVAMVIGMIATIVMFQVFSASEERRRATTGAGDTQSIGNITLLNLQNQIAQAGYGFIPSGDNVAMSLLGCQVQLRPSNFILTNFAPVVINHPSFLTRDANTDTLLVVYGAGTGSQEGAFLIHGSLQTIDDAEGGGAQQEFTYSLPSNSTYHNDDMVIAVPSAIHPGCQTIPVAIGKVRVPTNERGYIHADQGAEVSGGFLYNLGPMPGTVGLSSEQVPHARVYRVLNSRLLECDLMTNASGCADSDPGWVEIASDIVSLRAEYRWADGSFSQNTPDDLDRYCGFAQIRGVRLVVVARHPQLNKGDVTTQAPAWAGDEHTPIVLGEEDDDGWQKFRYTTFETLAPIRNVLWMGTLAGCAAPAPSGGG